MNEKIITIHCQKDLQSILQPAVPDGIINYPLRRRASIKDIVESLGLPHTEIGQLKGNGKYINFHYIPEQEMVIELHPFDTELVSKLPNPLWPKLWEETKFMVDINVAKLARNLRMIGIDTSMVPVLPLRDIGALARREKRIILTRNRELLKCKTILFGRLVRSENHISQLQEIVKLYSLQDKIKPFSRCITCNGRLQEVEKETVIERLQPLTIKYYDFFKQCNNCGGIFWQGSHHGKMVSLIESCGLA